MWSALIVTGWLDVQARALDRDERRDPRRGVRGPTSALEYLCWPAAAVLGNAVGGIVIVAPLDYGLVVAGGGRRGERKRASA